MRDRDLAAFMGLSPEEGRKVVPRLMPETRAAYERMVEVEKAIGRIEQARAPCLCALDRPRR